MDNFSRLISTVNGNVRIEIDTNSGFCFGVVNAVKLAENELNVNDQLASLGSIVHNEEEVSRLFAKGLKALNDNDFSLLKNTKVLFRAHGEPPSSYETAKQNNVKIIDATCPVVLKLQQRIKKAWVDAKKTDSQVVIYGKHGHAEVLGLVGQTNNQAIVIQDVDDFFKIDKLKPVVMFSQTTMSIEKYVEIGEQLKNYIQNTIKTHDTICRQVANRTPKLKKFVEKYELVIFVGGTKSSNAKFLFSECKKFNPNTIFISSISDLKSDYMVGKMSIGICGATSTPMWLMEKTADKTEQIVQELNL